MEEHVLGRRLGEEEREYALAGRPCAGAQVKLGISVQQRQADALEIWKALASHAACIRRHPEVVCDLARRCAWQALQHEWRAIEEAG